MPEGVVAEELERLLVVERIGLCIVNFVDLQSIEDLFVSRRDYDSASGSEPLALSRECVRLFDSIHVVEDYEDLPLAESLLDLDDGGGGGGGGAEFGGGGEEIGEESLLEAEEAVGRGGGSVVDVGEEGSGVEGVEELVEECFGESGFADAAHAVDAEDESGGVCGNRH